MDAEAWLATERVLVDRARGRQRESEFNTVDRYAERYLTERALRPNTVIGYRQLLDLRILPTFMDIPLVDITVPRVTSGGC